MCKQTYMVKGVEKEIIPNYEHLDKWNRMGLMIGLPMLICFAAIVFCVHGKAEHLLYWILPLPLSAMCVGMLYGLRLINHVKCVSCGKITDNVVRRERNQTRLFYCKHCDTLMDSMLQVGGDD